MSGKEMGSGATAFLGGDACFFIYLRGGLREGSSDYCLMRLDSVYLVLRLSLSSSCRVRILTSWKVWSRWYTGYIFFLAS